MCQIELCKSIAYEAHEGHYRRDGVTPYVEHLRRVSELCRLNGRAAVCAAWLHDVIEDTRVSASDLIERGIDCEVVEAVRALTKRRGETYDAYIARVSKNQTAKHVKLADMLDNLSDSPSASAVMKYKRAIMALWSD